MIRISLIHSSDPMAVKVGGEETFIRGFVKHAPLDFDIEQIGITTDPEARPVGRWSEVQIGSRRLRILPLCFDRNVNVKARVPLSLRFTWALANRRPDVSGRVLLFNRIEPACLFRSRRYPKIGFVHNDIQRRVARGSDSYWRFFRGLYFLLERHIFTSLDQVYAVSRRTAEFYGRRYSFLQGRVQFLPTWVDTEIFHPSPERDSSRARIAADFGVPDRVPWILYVGRLEEQKAPLRLVDTLALVRRTSPGAVLLIIGDGNLRSSVVARARQLGLQDAVHFLGFHSPERLRDFYAAADIFLLTSNFEGMPRACLEALGCGLPVVTTDVGEVRAVVRNGVSGEVTDDPSPDRLASAVLRIIADREAYSATNCVASIAAFTPQLVLNEVYGVCRELGNPRRT